MRVHYVRGGRGETRSQQAATTQHTRLVSLKIYSIRNIKKIWCRIKHDNRQPLQVYHWSLGIYIESSGVTKNRTNPIQMYAVISSRSGYKWEVV